MIGRRFISGRQALGVEYDMRDALYSQLVRLSFGFYDRHQTGQLMSRATIDLQSVRFFLGYGRSSSRHAHDHRHDRHLRLRVAARVVVLALAPLVVGIAYQYSRVSHPVLREVSSASARWRRSRRVDRRRPRCQVFRAGASPARTLPPRLGRGFRGQRPGQPPASALRAAALVRADAGSGGRTAPGWPDGRLGVALAGRLLRLRPAAQHARRATPDARHVDRPGAARSRFRRADLEVIDEPEGIADRPAAVALPEAGADRLLRRRVRLRGRDEGPGQDRSRRRAGHDRRPDRSHRLATNERSPRWCPASTTDRGGVVVDGADVREVTRRSLRRESG